METRHIDLFRIVLMLNYFVLFLSFTGVRSAQTKLSVMDIMKSDPQLCPTSKFLYDSEYIKPCASIAYPTGISFWNYNPQTLNSFLCLGVNDTAYKICQYSSQLQNLNYSTATFNSYVEKYVPNKNEDQEVFCNSLQGFTSLYNKSDSLWGQLVESLNKPHKCIRICFDFQDKFHPLCAVFAWIKSIDDNIKSAKKIETKQDSPDKLRINQSKDEITSDKTIPTESKKTSEANESKEQNKKQITADSNINNNIKKGDSNVPGNIPLANVKSDGEKTKSDTEKTSNIQKKINNTLEIPAHKSVPSTFKENKENIINTELGTNAEVVKSIKDIPPNSDSQAPSNNALNNVNKKIVNEKNTEKSNKEQDIDDFKTSTLSENTQDHYDGNPDENIENDIDDMDETIPHPDTGNQNEIVQEVLEQKNNGRLTKYSDVKTEDDSHFFTYFTVITLACLAGYIGYHNKQKIFAIVLEGRRSRSNRGRRRPSTASYRKLDCTLEEAVTSQCNANVTHVIY